ncbi:ATP-binding cassette domain-containing protein [Amycolatopsis anabasis]|uniref:ATP-binding cassette domain-containing protein n=1 Tax=Amycolatopsis anabasis TaxID=1840409 RepID=UPI00131C016F|nr:ATP-binding cassette domain-containing protein [Amycolatopsis anabasis]
MIHTRGLARSFRAKGETVEAVRGLDLDVEEGELVAFLGPNGAGKSTSLRMLTTLLPPTAGTATVAGHDVRADPAGVRRRIGYIGQGNGAGNHFRVRDELVTQGRCYGLSRAESRNRADELLAALDLEALARRTAETLSGGQRRRLDVAIGLVHRPELLFLDEPSTGLDPHNRANLWEHILRVREQYGMTIFLTTHYLEEADTMAERVLVIDHGRVIADDTPGNLKAELAGDRIVLATGNDVEARRVAAAGERRAHRVEIDGTTVILRVTRGDEVLPVFLRSLDASVDVLAAEVRRPTLDDVFLALTGRSLRESGQ